MPRYGPDDLQKETSRRRFTAGTAALAATGLAGCAQLGDSQTETDGSTEASTDASTEAPADTQTGDTDTATDEVETEAEATEGAMQWERRQDAEGGRVTAMWLLVQDGGIIAELTVEDQRYRGFPDSFVTFLKDTGWVYEDKWNVLGQFDEYAPAIDRAREEISGSDAAAPVSVEMSFSEPQHPAFRGESGATKWYRRRDLEGGKEMAVWHLYENGNIVDMLMVETNAYKLTYTGGEQASYVWRISPDEQLNRKADGTLTDDPAKWNNITPFDSPHTSMPDAMKEALGVLEDSDHPVDGGLG
jgi:hypothetical protein